MLPQTIYVAATEQHLPDQFQCSGIQRLSGLRAIFILNYWFVAAYALEFIEFTQLCAVALVVFVKVKVIILSSMRIYRERTVYISN